MAFRLITSKSTYHPLIVAALFVLGTALVARADDRSAQQLIVKYCVDCHGKERPEADVRLDEPSASSRDLETWHSVWRKIHAGEMPPEDAPQPSPRERESLLEWIEENNGKPDAMDPGDHWSLKPPSRSAIPRCGSWASSSNVASSSTNTQSSNPHHSSELNRGCLSPIDAFVLQRLNHAGLTPSNQAKRNILLRRASLDLTGLPPTEQELHAFLNDPDPLEFAFERVVDRLLHSEHYGERWTQHWLDVIRWAETVGFETNAERRDAWHYRDWLIRAFNMDMPYDQLIAEQIIGDETGSDAALGFLVAGPANLPGQIGRDEEAMRQARQDELDEVIRTVSQSLFGLTVGCARCHDHKFDPITQADYYSMQAVFAALRYGTRRMRGPINDQWSSEIPKTQAELDQLHQQRREFQNRFALRDPLGNIHSETFPPIVASAVRMEISATTNGTASLYEFEVFAADSKSDNSQSKNVALASAGAKPSASSFALANQTRHFDNLIDGSVDRRQAFPWVAAQRGPAWIQIELPEPTRIERVQWHNGQSVPLDYVVKVRLPTGQWRTVAQPNDRMLRTDDARPAQAIQLKGVSNADIDLLVKLLAQIRKVTSQLNRLSAGPQTYAARFEPSPPPTKLLRRGDPMQPVGEVVASPPSVLNAGVAPGPFQSELDRRKMLVAHLVSPSHPLTARVMVNRIWQHHFGIGLVATSSDFGRMGARPSHPELLDWLAVEFVQNGWSIKRMHRLIMLSKTYMQSSRPREAAMRVDADARLLWRYPARRLDAEAIRDSILQVCGNLNRRMYGRGFDFFNQRGGLSDYRDRERFAADGLRRMIYAHRVRMQSVDVFGAFDCPDAGQMTPRRNQSITPIQALGLFNSPFVQDQSTAFARQIELESNGNAAHAIDLAFRRALGRSPSKIEVQKMLDLQRTHSIQQVCRVILNLSEFVYLQ